MLRNLGQFYDMNLEFIAVLPPPFIFPHVKAGIELLVFLKQNKVQNPYVDAFSQDMIAFARQNHIGIHLAQIEQRTLPPKQEFRHLDLHIKLDIPVQNYTHIQNSQLVFIVPYPQMSGKQFRLDDFLWFDPQHRRYKALPDLFKFHQLLETKIHLRLHDKVRRVFHTAAPFFA